MDPIVYTIHVYRSYILDIYQDVHTELANGRVSMSFIRPLVGGKLQAVYGVNASIATSNADLIWAVGTYNKAAGAIGYHGNIRGLRMVDWNNPAAMGPLRCK